MGVKDSDIITACRLVLFRAPILTGPPLFPALRGFPRFPCVRNHPPTCCSRRGLQTVKPNTQSLWAAGRALMKDSAGAQGITNTRLQHTHTHTHARLQCQQTLLHTQGGQSHCLVQQQQPGLMGAGVWAERGAAAAGRDG